MQDRFKFRIIAEKEVKTFNGTFKGQSIYYCNGFIQTKLKTYFFGNHKKYSFLNSQIKAINQCTGLKDKNGKLIYEGDIVKINTHYNHLVCDDYEYDCESEKGYSLFKIIYDDDMARFGAERIKCVKWVTRHYSLDYVPHNHKVIGNIYENKELLED